MNKSDIEYFPLVSRLESPLWVSLVCTGGKMQYYQKALGWNYSIENYKYEEQTHQIGKPDAVRLVELIDNFAQQGDFYEFYIDRCRRGVQSLLDQAHDVYTLSKSHLSGDPYQLFLHLNEVFQRMIENMPFLASLVLIQNRLESELRQKLAEEFNIDSKSREIGEFLSVAVVPTKQSNFVRESRNVLRIASEIQKLIGADQEISFDQLPQQLQDEIDKHIFEYGWLGTFTFFNDPYSHEDIITRINLNLKRNPAQILEDTISREKEALSLAEEAITSITNTRLRELLYYAQEYLYWRFERVDAFFKAEVLTRGLQRQLAKKLGIERDEIPMITYQEFVDWSTEKRELPEKSERLLRKQLGINYYVTNGIHRFELGKPVDFTIEPELREKVFESGLEGTTACPGEAEGVVRIVRSVADINKVNEGDILVTSMTTPDLMLAIEKAAAIITDEGGILCHAAIISRELNIPCIIGTENATRSFQDGDVVRMQADSNTGIVQLLEKH